MIELSSGRCGKYFDNFKDRDNYEQKTLYDVCIKLGLKDIGYARETLQLSKYTETEDKMILSYHDFIKELPPVYDNLYC